MAFKYTYHICIYSGIIPTMEAHKALLILTPGVYKYVARAIAPSILYMANMDRGMTHGFLAFEAGLARITGDSRKPYEALDPESFRAGRLTLTEDGQVIGTGVSSDFTARKFILLDDQPNQKGLLQDLFTHADITIY